MYHRPLPGVRRNHGHQLYDPYSHYSHHVHDPFAHDIWDPFHEFHLEPPRSFIAPPPTFHHGPSSMVQIESKDTDEAHIFRANLNGYKKEEVKVQVEDDRVLKIAGEKKIRKEDNHNNWHHSEHSNGKFFTSFSLPKNAKGDCVKSSMENGVLTITVPKKEIKKPHLRTVQIH